MAKKRNTKRRAPVVVKKSQPKAKGPRAAKPGAAARPVRKPARKPAPPRASVATVKKGVKTLAWGILGTGRIAKKLAAAINASTLGKLVSVGSRSKDSAAKFGLEFGLPPESCYGSYEELVADPRVEAVYISLPNDLHAYWTSRCAEKGKANLCEKPLAMNFPEAMRMVEAARYHNAFLLEAFMYRCHPQTAELVDLIKRHTIGEVRVIQANFSYGAPDWWDDIRCKPENGGGGIMDVGCYTASMSRLIAGAAMGKDFADPLEIKGTAYINPKSGVDHWAAATVRFPGPEGRDIIANLTCGMSVGVDSTLRIFGREGSIVVPNPWFPGEKGNKIIVHRQGDAEPKTILVDGGSGVYTLEADTVVKAVWEGKKQAAPAMTWADTLSNMKMLDDWRRAVGLVYPGEKADAPPDAIPVLKPITGRPPARRADHAMTYGRVPGVEKPISRAVMGTMIFNPNEMPLTCAMLDHFVEVGGNCIDTAHIYSGGNSEPAVGRWVKSRGIREELVIIGKGGHTPNCTPQGISRQLLESLERQQTDYFDIYMLHRDNTDLPAGELVEALAEHLKAGRIRAYGGSNWTTRRIDEANAYAAQKGLPLFAASSPNLSLARWNRPPWDGCVTASDAASRAWHTQNQMPMFAWSSQANGFFTGRYGRNHQQAAPGDYMATLVAPVWFNDDNFTRLERAQELAKKKGVTATQIALAYVLNRPFPTFALIGPRTIEELRTSLDGMNLALSEEEMRWLSLE